jgi:hypothetical protein
MPGQDDDTKDPCSIPGVPVATGGAKKTNLAEQARRSREKAPDVARPKKLPPKPGRLPEGRAVDPKEILNPDQDDS